MTAQLTSFAILMGAFLALLAVGVPVFFAMGLAAVAAIAASGGQVPLNVIALHPGRIEEGLLRLS